MAALQLEEGKLSEARGGSLFLSSRILARSSYLPKKLVICAVLLR